MYEYKILITPPLPIGSERNYCELLEKELNETARDCPIRSTYRDVFVVENWKVIYIDSFRVVFERKVANPITSNRED